MPQLNGKLYLIRGNHDRRVVQRSPQDPLEKGFTTICGTKQCSHIRHCESHMNEHS